MTFIWDAPATGGTLRHYNHRIGVLDGAQIEESNTTTNLTGTATYTKTGLTNGTTYYFQVRGVNTDGAGTFARIEATPSACNAPDPYPSGARQGWTGKVKARQITASIHRQEAISGFEHDPPRGLVNPNHSNGKGDSELDNPHFSGRHVATINLLGVTRSPAGTLRLGTTGVIRDEERKQFTLYVCDTPFHFRDASVSGKLLSWSSSGLDWSVHPERTLYIHRDSTAPTVASVEVTDDGFGNDILLITFTEELNRINLPVVTAFTAKKTPAGGSEQTASFISNSRHGYKTWGRVLSGAILPTDTVTVSYAKPTSGNKLRDLFGNEVESFTDVLARKRHEPSGQDFSNTADTLGFVSVGKESTGRLVYPEDGSPYVGMATAGDTFTLVGLESRKTYRVEVVFRPGPSDRIQVETGEYSVRTVYFPETVGGSIQLENCCSGGELYPVSEWDSNYDGFAIFDFDTGRTESGNTRWVTIIPGNSMNPDIWFYGYYTVTLTDVTGLTRLVSNTRQRGTTVTYAKVGKDTLAHATKKIELASSFTTGGHTDGYTLDRITAYISMSDGTDTGVGAPRVAIHSNGASDVPGTKLCDLQMLADYETGLILSNGDWPDRLYAPDCADNTLAANTTYWVVFSEGSSTAQTYYVGYATKGDEDAGGASRWSIGNTIGRQLGTDGWQTRATQVPVAIGVYGTPK